jgi:hypothetical protein
LGILTDNSPKWRPNNYEIKLCGVKILTFYFQTIKLLDYNQKRDFLEQTSNIFGSIVLAQLAALETKKKSNERFNQKLALTRRLYEKGLSRDYIVNLYTFIDWVLTLPEALEISYNQHIRQLEEDRKVNYVTSGQRLSKQEGIEIGIQQGMQQGMQQGEYSLLLRLIERKFKTVPASYRKRLKQADADTLLMWGDRLFDADSLDELFE